jgi:hypothetical protein
VVTTLERWYASSMHEYERVKLLGQYKTPRFKYGSVVTCAIRGKVKIVALTDGRIPWLKCQMPNGPLAIILYGALADAVRRESVEAIKFWFGVGNDTVWRWRKALGVGVTAGTSALLSRWAPETCQSDKANTEREPALRSQKRAEKIAAAKRGKPRPTACHRSNATGEPRPEAAGRATAEDERGGPGSRSIPTGGGRPLDGRRRQVARHDEGQGRCSANGANGIGGQRSALCSRRARVRQAKSARQIGRLDADEGPSARNNAGRGSGSPPALLSLDGSVATQTAQDSGIPRVTISGSANSSDGDICPRRKGYEDNLARWASQSSFFILLVSERCSMRLQGSSTRPPAGLSFGRFFFFYGGLAGVGKIRKRDAIGPAAIVGQNPRTANRCCSWS